MDLQKRNKLLTFVVLILIGLNIMTVGYIWYGYAKERPAFSAPSPEGRMGDMILSRRLNLSQEQAEQIARLRQEHFLRTGQLMQQLSELRKEMAAAAFSDTPDTQKVNRLAAQIGTLRADLEKQFILHLSQIRAVCTPQQRQRCDRFFRRILEKSDPLNRPGWKMRHRGRWGEKRQGFNTN